MKHLLSQLITLWHRKNALIAYLLIFSTSAFAQNEDTKITINNWLHLGNFDVKKPAYNQQKNLGGETFENADLLQFNFLDVEKFEPKTSSEVRWKNNTYEWSELKSAKNDFVEIEKKAKGADYQIGFLAAYIHATQWMKAEIELSSSQLLEFYLDGKMLKSKETENQKEEDPGKVSCKLTLEKGKHLILIKSLKTAENNADWKIKAELKIDESFPQSALTTSISPTKFMTINHLLEGKSISSASISPDGDLFLLKYSQTTPPNGDQSGWSEVISAETGQLVQSFREAEIHNIKWVPSGKAVAYETSEKDNSSSLWVFDFADMSLKNILAGVDDFDDYTWSDDLTFIIYSVSEKADQKSGNMKRFEGMPDRWPWWRSRSFLYRLDVASGVSEQLTFGHISTNLMDIRNDGQKILFSQDIPDFSERPYSRQFLMEMDIETYSIDTIWEKNFGGNCQYAPDGLHLLVTGSPVLFGSIGKNITGDVIPNDYDTQAYIYDMTTGEADPISFNFNPSIENAVWSKYDKNIIYFLAADRTYKRIFTFDLNTKYFDEVNTGIDVINSMSLAENAPLGVFTGSGISTPKYAVSINLTDGEIKTIANPQAETYKNVVFGKTEEWNFINKNGVEIEGRIYYPPDFDKDKKYPLIVYYYAGTSPTERSFGGRYPKNIFAAQGYVVYNLQPSGAIGYGQDFSAAHVNNWGISVADEIIDGTKLFLNDHAFIDQEKIGCIGASYGGFMTMLLQTRTDIFAAAISHAGISSIASYWGEGYWGYLYSSVASANSFPWNNKKLYVDQSALFNADKINTPLLLLHGDADTNVPPGESIQLYTALKLLGKPVELIEIKGQNHQIVDYKKRIEWQNTIFAWFDKWLKDQPQWWNDLYPDRNL
ncbi:MAG: S9 family peptidase [Bacteroidales bacterium]|nr:S9 family peptidase [Bacteroidales bacterium]